MKKILWIIGSNASGKTTQSRLLHKMLGTSDKQIFSGTQNDIVWSYTSFGRVAHVGAFNDNQCTGTDTLGEKISVEFSFLKCLLDEESEYVILDPIMSTAKYVEMLKQFDIELILVYLHFETPEANFERVIYRRQKKTGEYNIVLSDKTKENVARKQQNFYNLYKRVKDVCDKSIKIDASLPEKEIHNKIKKLINE